MGELDEAYHDYSENYSWYEDYPTVCDKEDVRSFGGTFLPVVYALALLVGLAGNSLVVAVYMRHKKLRTMTDVYILNLAVADLALLLTLPFWAADAALGWQLGEAACKLAGGLYGLNFACGMLFLACISVDRYRAVACRGRQPSLRGRARLAVCLAVWAAAFLLSAPDMVFSTVRLSTTHRHICLPVYPHSMGLPAKAALEVLEVLLIFLLPFMVMVFCYSRVARALRGFPEQQQGRRRRAFKVLVAVVGVFLATQLPYSVVKFLRAMDTLYTLVTHCEVSKGLDRAAQVTESLALTHSCLNPILYAFLGSSLQQHLLRLAKELGQLGRGRRPARGQEQVVEISLNSHSGSEDTSLFTI